MSVFQKPLGMDVKNNPIKHSVFSVVASIEDDTPPSSQTDITTEGGTFILTEGGAFITTE